MSFADEERERIAAVTGGLLPKGTVVRAGRLRLYCWTWGEEDDLPVLLVHGAGLHAHWWDAVVPALVPGWRLIVPDLRGHGRSDWAQPPSYLLEDFSADLVAIVDALADGSVVVAGHSMGGRVATWIAAHWPQRVRALALLDTRFSGLSAERVQRWRRTAAGGRKRRDDLSREEALASFRLTPEEPGVSAAILANLAHHAVREHRPRSWGLRFDRAALALDGSRVADLTPLLPRIECPALMLRGVQSDVAGAKASAEIAAAIGGCEVHTFPGGHHFPLVHPQAVGRVLRGFFERKARDRGQKAEGR